MMHIGHIVYSSMLLYTYIRYVGKCISWCIHLPGGAGAAFELEDVAEDSPNALAIAFRSEDRGGDGVLLGARCGIA